LRASIRRQSTAKDQHDDAAAAAVDSGAVPGINEDTLLKHEEDVAIQMLNDTISLLQEDSGSSQDTSSRQLEQMRKMCHQLDTLIKLRTVMVIRAKSQEGWLADAGDTEPKPRMRDLALWVLKEHTLSVFAAVITTLAVISCLYTVNQLDWTVDFSLYFFVVTALTIGYGDHSYEEFSNGDVWFLLVIMILAVFTVQVTLFVMLEKVSESTRTKLGEAHVASVEALISGGDAEEIFEQIEQSAENGMIDDEEIVLQPQRSQSKASILSLDLTLIRRRAMGALNFLRSHEKLRYLFYAVLINGAGIIFAVTHLDDNFTDSLYWVFVTGLTVGYGDQTPHIAVQNGTEHCVTESPDSDFDCSHWSLVFSHLFSVIYLPFSVASFYALVASVARMIILQGKSVHKVLKMKLSHQLLSKMDDTGAGVVDELEFVCAMLIMLGKADRSILHLIRRQFDILDVDGDRVLTVQDILLHNSKHTTHALKNRLSQNKAPSSPISTVPAPRLATFEETDTVLEMPVTTEHKTSKARDSVSSKSSHLETHTM